MTGPLRRPAVAGQFYAAQAGELQAEVEACYLSSRGPGRLPVVAQPGPRRLLGLVCPHAGYVYSGPVAAHAYAALADDGRPQRIVLLGPHHGRGRWVSALQTRGAWQTPLGQAPIDTELAERLAAALPDFADDPQVLAAEHSLEVQLPFLQHLLGAEVPFVPLQMLDQDLGAARRLGEALGQVLAGEDVVIIASTDLTHQETRPRAAAQDHLLIDKLLALDPEGLLAEREKRDISMCGYGPTAAMLLAAQALGAQRAEVLRYGDSAEAHPMDTVVGYLAAGVYRGED